MQVNNNGELLISINGKTKLLSKEEIVKMYNQGTILASDSNSVTNTTKIIDEIGHIPWLNIPKKEENPYLNKVDYPYFVTHTAESYPNPVKQDLNAPAHYNNEKGSLYEFCNRNDINAWEFDIIKRVIRCRKKGQFKEDLEKTKFLIDLYLKEYQ